MTRSEIHAKIDQAGATFDRWFGRLIRAMGKCADARATMKRLIRNLNQLPQPATDAKAKPTARKKGAKPCK